MGSDYLSQLFRSSPLSYLPGLTPDSTSADSAAGNHEQLQQFEQFIRGVLGQRDENDVFTRGGKVGARPDAQGQSPFANMDPQTILGLLVDMALRAENKPRPQPSFGAQPGTAGRPVATSQSWPSFPSNGGNWGSGAPVSGGWSGGGSGGGGGGSVAPASGGSSSGTTPAGTTNRPTGSGGPGNASEPFKGGNNVVPRQGDFSGTQGSSGCGPLAAIGLARALGKNPDIQQTFDVASQVGWGAEGMGGPGNYMKLLERMGIPARLDYNVDASAIQKSVEDGKPVTLSTARHYFLATDYDPSTGKYFVGNSGTALSGGKEWMSIDEINALGNGINGVIYPN